MRSNKGLGRRAARAKRLAAETASETPKRSTYHVTLAWRFAKKPNFRNRPGKVVIIAADVNVLKRAVKAEKDISAGRGGQKVSRLAVRSAHRRKVKAEKRTCKCPACHKGEV